MKRYVTYDIREGNSYEELYNYFFERKAKKVTESTYEVVSNLDFDTFCNKIKSLTSYGDCVAVISAGRDGAFYRKVR